MKYLRYFFSGEMLMVATTLFAAIGWMASKEVVNDVSPNLFIGARFILAGMLLLPGCWRMIFSLSRKLLWQAIVLGILMTVAMQTWIIGLSRTNNIGEGAFITSTAILLSPLLGWGLFGIRPNKSFWWALPIAIVGLGCLSLTNGWQIEMAQLLFLLAAILISLHFNLNKQLTHKMSALSLVTLQLFAGGVFSLILSLLSSQTTAIVNQSTLIWFAVSVVLSTSLRYVLQALGQSRNSTATAAVIMILEPVWVLFLGIAFYQESLPLQKIVGAGLIIFSLLLYRYLQRAG